MSRLDTWNTTVECGKTVPTGECKGRVLVKGYRHTESINSWLDGLGGPPGESTYVGACDTCGFDDWTEEEIAEMTTQAREDSDAGE